MESSEKELRNVIKIDEKRVEDHVREIVRGSVEETLNALLDEEADRICRAQRYEHSPERVDTRAGHYERSLETTSGKVKLKVPKLRKLPFESAIIERYRRREVSVEEALVEMYLAGVSVRRVEDITEALWGTRISTGTLSNLNKKVYVRIEEWRNRPIEGSHPYVYLDGIVLKRSWAGEVKNISVLVAIAVNQNGFREILGVCEGAKEDKEGWGGFLKSLKSRGMRGVGLFISDKCLGLVESIEEIFPESKWQRCVVHFYRNVFSVVPNDKIREVSAMLKAIHAQEGKREAKEKAAQVVEKLLAMRLRSAAQKLEEGIRETISYMDFPREHWVRIRTNNPLERIMREIRRRTRVVGNFPDGQSALMLVAARLRHIAQTKWGEKRYATPTKLLEERAA